jgi:hypothetical protein
MAKNITVINVFDKSPDSEIQKTKIVVIHRSEREGFVIEPIGGHLITLQGEHLTINVDSKARKKTDYRILYQEDVYKHIEFIKGRGGPNPNKPEQYSPKWRKLKVPIGTPKWQIKITEQPSPNPLPEPDDLRQEVDSYTSPGNVEVGDDNQ